MQNVHFEAIEEGTRVVFAHRVKDGPTDRSYGLQVAALAGLPDSVLRQARARLDHLSSTVADGAAAATSRESQLALFTAAAPHPVVEAVESIDPDNLTAKQALDLVLQATRTVGVGQIEIGRQSLRHWAGLRSIGMCRSNEPYLHVLQSRQQAMA